MIPDRVLAAVRARLARELAPPAARVRPLDVDGENAGWFDDVRFARLAATSAVFQSNNEALSFIPALSSEPERTRALDRVAHALSAEGLLTAWRDERYAVAADFGAPPWFLLERAAARYFGVHTYAVHINGLVRRGDETLMWIARRSPTKAIDPGLLDNLVGGGIAYGQSIASTVVKEAWEEAGIPPDTAMTASPAGEVHVCRVLADGLERETIFVYDILLADDFTPACQDGEAVEHRLVAMRDAGALIANETGPGVVTANASLVILDCLLRHGAIAPDAPLRASLEALRQPAVGTACAFDP
jgi:8-oxo-dGTP pyrophosphatase MutT (NUDIX family)